MGCHADNEKESGANPVIASLSFGDERCSGYIIKRCKASLDIMLGHGDLLLMAGTMQHHWLHALPKTKQLRKPRINLTFPGLLVN